MYFKKKDLPQEDEIVYCTVKKILYHSVFCILDEYENKEGMLHISEIAPGRIRNIRDYVKEGKKIVCKVLRVNKEKGHIDLSLRRVPLSIRNQKIDEIRQESKSEKIVEAVAEKLKIKTDDLFKKLGLLFDKYDLLNYAFMDIVLNGEKVWDDLKLDAKIKKELVSLVKERIKPPEIKLEGILVLTCEDSEGVEVIKKSLLKGEAIAKKNKYDAKITYVGSPNYKVEVTEQDVKKAQKQMTEIVDAILTEIKKQGGNGEFKKK